MLVMLPQPDSALPSQIDAVTSRRTHAGKLMIISRAEGREPALSDFFHFDSVGAHPTGIADWFRVRVCVVVFGLLSLSVTAQGRNRQDPVNEFGWPLHDIEGRRPINYDPEALAAAKEARVSESESKHDTIDLGRVAPGSELNIDTPLLQRSTGRQSCQDNFRGDTGVSARGPSAGIVPLRNFRLRKATVRQENWKAWPLLLQRFSVSGLRSAVSVQPL